MSYIDLSREDVRQQHPEVIGQLRKGELVLPAVFVDGEVVCQGYVDYYSVARAIEQSSAGTPA